MRGKRVPQAAHHSTERNIPAHAGKTLALCATNQTPTEHPRACGENRRGTARASGAGGTSPRMRGKPNGPPQLTSIKRNIPAHAGKTSAASAADAMLAEHPRACGENHHNPPHATLGPGTSPRMRGKPRQQQLGSVSARNIPAHAGKTTRNYGNIGGHEEHPRACGENDPPYGIDFHTNGTSPRMRGKPQPTGHPATPARNIPAHAGKTPGEIHADAA